MQSTPPMAKMAPLVGWNYPPLKYQEDRLCYNTHCDSFVWKLLSLYILIKKINMDNIFTDGHSCHLKREYRVSLTLIQLNWFWWYNKCNKMAYKCYTILRSGMEEVFENLWNWTLWRGGHFIPFRQFLEKTPQTKRTFCKLCTKRNATALFGAVIPKIQNN